MRKILTDSELATIKASRKILQKLNKKLSTAKDRLYSRSWYYNFMVELANEAKISFDEDIIRFI